MVWTQIWKTHCMSIYSSVWILLVTWYLLSDGEYVQFMVFTQMLEIIPQCVLLIVTARVIQFHSRSVQLSESIFYILHAHNRSIQICWYTHKFFHKSTLSYGHMCAWGQEYLQWWCWCDSSAVEVEVNARSCISSPFQWVYDCRSRTNHCRQNFRHSSIKIVIPLVNHVFKSRP